MSKVYVVQIYSEDTEGSAITSVCDSTEIAKEHIRLVKNSIVNQFEREGYSCNIEEDDENDGWRIWITLQKEDSIINLEVFCVEFELNSTNVGQMLEANHISQEEIK